MDIAKTLSWLRPNAQWSIDNNDYAQLIWHDSEAPPTLEELQAAWDQLQQIKTWPNVQSFMVAFTMQEKAAIALSTDPTIAALRLELTTWLSSVPANSPAVLTGLDKLVELQILTPQRKTEILATAT
jgi:hypothetical protein